MMQAESAFPRLLDLIRRNKDDDTGLHRLLLELLCEMSRIQRLSCEDLRECILTSPRRGQLTWRNSNCR